MVPRPKRIGFRWNENVVVPPLHCERRNHRTGSQLKITFYISIIITHQSQNKEHIFHGDCERRRPSDTLHQVDLEMGVRQQGVDMQFIVDGTGNRTGAGLVIDSVRFIDL